MGALLMLDPRTQYTTVYAGAVPGIHVPLLAELFPNVAFHLYDPTPFSISAGPRIRLHNQLYTDADAAAFAGTQNLRLVFLCDIRNTADDARV